MIIKFSIDDLYQLEQKNYSTDRVEKIRAQLLSIENFKKHENWLKSTKNVIALNYTLAFLAVTKDSLNIYKLFKCADNNEVFDAVIAENMVPYEINNGNNVSNKESMKISVIKNGISSAIDINVDELPQNLQQEKDDYLFVSEVLSNIIKILKN